MSLPFDLRSLSLFVAVVDHGGFSAAARARHIAQSAVSQTIAGLERRLDTRLFERHDRRVRLTPEGEVLLEHARRLLADASATELALKELNGLVKGEVRIGIPSMLGSYYLPPLLMGFAARHPGIRMTVIEAGARRLQAMIKARELDLGIVVEDGSTCELETEALLRAEMVVCTTRDHPFTARHSVTPEAFLSEPLVLFQDGYFHREFVDAMARRLDIQPRLTFQSNLIPLTKAIVSQGFGITTFLRRVIEEDDLSAVSFDPAAWLTLSLAWQPQGYLSRAERAFIDYALSQRDSL
ncbi:LysR substrate-binding domain-containing protein [Halomonas sp.]|uniref:LysR family transcriptional regulator n=1 Tax=Halomonas sp. TaxID=1486246 RepID=UPI0025794784|nr:LysR substrate-binding domain-containing protein [Halomonas sp.]MCJ8287164.1 LysR substrate-binding domain-containing protein [Halomonas sp.]NQY71879.1 LysR family transcriptional regulator [Halomonas sp.]